MYFNEPAEAIFGRPFEEMGGLPPSEWEALLEPSDADGRPLPHAERPLPTALERRVPAHRQLFIRAASTGAGPGERREIAVTAVPLTALGDRFLGALALLWQPQPDAADVEPTAGEGPCPGSHAVETILTRRVATTLATPVFLVDHRGELLYFNPPAEPILGHRFLEGGLGSREELFAAFRPRTTEGNPMAPDEHPLSIARARGQPVHGELWIDGLDGRSRRIDVTSIPLIGQSDRLVGAFGLFWENAPT